MRKLLLTTAFILPLGTMPVMAQDAATTEAPAGDAMNQPAGDAAAPMGTDAAADPAADPAVADADAAAQEAEVAASGKVAQDQAANELRVDWINDATVTSPDGTSIGDINDLIVDGETGQMIAAVIGVGGFLGIGEKQIAVPWDQLTVNYDAQEVTSELTKEEADAAPEYVFRERESAPSAEAPAGGDTMATDPAAAPADPAAAPADATGTDTMAPAEGADTDMATEPAAGGDMAAEPAEGGDMAAEPAEGGDMAAEPAGGGDMAAEPAEGGDMTTEPAEGADSENMEEQPASN